MSRSITAIKSGRTFRNTCIVVGILSIMADVATIPHDAYVGILGSPSSGFTFAPLLWPFNLPMLNVIGMVLGLTAITSAFASERGGSVLASIGSGLALTLSTSWGSLTSAHFDVGWPLAWAHQLFTFGPPGSLPMFYLDMTGLLIDVAFWTAAVGIALSLLRLYLRRRANPVGGYVQQQRSTKRKAMLAVAVAVRLLDWNLRKSHTLHAIGLDFCVDSRKLNRVPSLFVIMMPAVPSRRCACLMLVCLLVGSASNPLVCLASLLSWNPPFRFQSPAIEVAYLGVWHGTAVTDYVRGGIIYGHTINEWQDMDPSLLTTAFVGGDAAVVSQVPRFTFLLGQRRRRSRFDLYVCILELLQDRSMTMGEIAFCARLNFSMAKRFLDDLGSKSFVQGKKSEEQTVYHLTPSGEALLADLRRIYDKLGR